VLRFVKTPTRRKRSKKRKRPTLANGRFLSLAVAQLSADFRCFRPLGDCVELVNDAAVR
jgi:hypothetical protein